MKLSYWFAKIIDDRDVFSVRERTKREALAAIERSGSRFEPLRKVTVEYADGFDLLQKARSGGLVEEGSVL